MKRREMKQDITPIFIIGAARNGTTNLENTIASFPQVAGAEHWLHHGSHESNVYQNKKYWGDLTDAYSYIRFLYQYSASDYFSLSGGKIEYHLNHKKDNFYEFFFDLMDHYAVQQRKNYWITKLDPNFSFDEEENTLFFSYLKSRYEDVKFIRIKRVFKASFQSYINMEGKNYAPRQKKTFTFPALILQASRYVLTYGNVSKDFDCDILEIAFEDYIKNRKKHIRNIANYLNIELVDLNRLSLDHYNLNTSFVNKSKKELPGYITFLQPFVLRILERYPATAKFIWKFYYRRKRKTNPIFHRILCYEYFREDLMRELAQNNAAGLLEKIQEKKQAGP